jgi:hypothetical protein
MQDSSFHEEATPRDPREGPSPEMLYQWYVMAGGKEPYSSLVDCVLDAHRTDPTKYLGVSVKESLYYLLRAMVFTQSNTLDKLVRIAEQYEAENMAKLPPHLQEFCRKFRSMLDDGHAA